MFGLRGRLRIKQYYNPEEIIVAKDNVSNYTATIEIGENSKVKLTDDVIATIAGLAATEVEGVAAMKGNVTNEMMAVIGVKNLTKGVVIDVQDDIVSVKLALSMRYGYSIPKTSAEVQDRVKNAIENMTGLTVSCVDVHITGIQLDKK